MEVMFYQLGDVSFVFLSPQWFEDKYQEVENEEQQLRKLHALVDSLVNHRKGEFSLLCLVLIRNVEPQFSHKLSPPNPELCGNTAVFAKSMAMLGNSEDNTALSRALSQLAELEDKMEQLHQEQAASDFFIFEELLADYIRLLGAVRVSVQLQTHGKEKLLTNKTLGTSVAGYGYTGSQQGSGC